VECWKCGYKGHIQAECCSKTKKKGWKGKKVNDLKKGKDSSNVVPEGKEFAFMTMFAGAMLACNRSPLFKLEVNVYVWHIIPHVTQLKTVYLTHTNPPWQIKAADQTLSSLPLQWVSCRYPSPTRKDSRTSHYRRYSTAQTLLL